MADADVVIAGGGTAGCILAARLSENPTVRVILLEAGADTAPGCEPADIADMFPRAFANPSYFWPGLSAGMTGGEPARPFKQPRILGGGSSVMGLWALRGLAADYDGWAASGAHGWAFADVLPFFKTLETDLDYPVENHGSDGPIPVRRIKRANWPGFITRLGEAAQTHQIALREDFNATDADGMFPLPNSIAGSSRASSPSQYLTAAVRARCNLDIRTGLQVSHVALEGRRAIGVNVLRPGAAPELIRARRVVVSAGAIHSPALLLRSGIGPADEIAACGITPKLDLPAVGRNLHNHLYVHMGALIRSGLRQSPGERQFAIAGARISSRQADCPPGDLFVSFIARTIARDPGNQIGIVGGHLYAPASRGYVRLAGPDPTRAPLVDFRTLSDERDARRLMQVARLGCDLIEHPRVVDATLDRFMLPANPPLGLLNGPGLLSGLMSAGVGALPLLPQAARRAMLAAVIGSGRMLDGLGRGAAFEQLVRASYTSMFHPVGTCAIGRVIGAERLNVVDASIMPTIPRANTNLPTSMVAERASVLIAEQLKA